MKPRFPESKGEKAMRIARTAARMAGPVPGALESGGKASLSPPDVLERRIAHRLAASVPEMSATIVAALAASKARDGHATALKLARGEIKAVDLTDDAVANLESVIRVSDRPAWFVRQNFPDINDDASAQGAQGVWIQLATAANHKMRSVCSAVGCIMLQQAGVRVAIGTGWLIAKRTLVTNAHVAGHLAWKKPGVPADDPRGGWRLRPDVIGVVDFAYEHEAHTGPDVGIEQVLYVESGEAPDIAIFRIADAANVLDSRPVVTLDLNASRAAGWAETFVFAVGHPIADMQNDTSNVATVFGLLDGTKRMSPGKVVTLLGTDVLAHDCSTTNGSSGSPLVDFTSYEAVGLHYFGQPGERNEAVFFAALAAHPAIVKSKSGNWGT